MGSHLPMANGNVGCILVIVKYKTLLAFDMVFAKFLWLGVCVCVFCFML